MKKNKYLILTVLGIVSILVSSIVSYADNAEANKYFKIGLGNMKSKNYRTAASNFMAAKIQADDTLLKANALKAAAGAYRKAKLLRSEYECVEKLLNSYPNHADYAEAVKREFEIADCFYSGHRDSPFSWLPWIKESNYSKVIYENALKHAPFAKSAPEARLRLGRLYIEDNKIDEGLKTLRDVIKLHNGTESQKYAYFQIGNVLLQLAESGDGDGSYGREARTIFRTIMEKYPDDIEIHWVEKSAVAADNYSANYLYNMAKFYNRKEKAKVSTKYLYELINNYPDSKFVADAERMLVKLDKKYTASNKRPSKREVGKYLMKPMSAQPERIIVIPENSSGKWLLPIEDFSSDLAPETDKYEVIEEEK